MSGKRSALIADLQEEKTQEKRPRKQLKRRLTEEAVERTISEHYGNFSSKQIRVDLVEGKTLVEHLLEKKRAARRPTKSEGMCGSVPGLNVAANTSVRDEMLDALRELTRLQCTARH